MSGANKGKSVLRSVGAVFAGLVVIFVLSLGTDAILHALGIYPPWGQTMSNPLFALATAYRIVYGIIGCYIAGRLAPFRPMAHATALGAFGLFFSTAGALAMGDMGPRWYALAIIAINFPCTWIGGRLAEKSGKSAADSTRTLQPA
jgi:hypothetical protein